MSTTDGTLQTANQGASGVSAEAVGMLNTFWERTTNEINCLSPKAFKTHELPLARIKKIMKLDEDVKMISAEAPVLFAKAAEIFVSELSLRAWVHTEDNKRRTLQRNDIAMAISKYDQFDFLIDIVPREELKPAKRPEDTVRTNTSMVADQVQFFIQMAQQATGNAAAAATGAATGTVQQLALQQAADQQQAAQVQAAAQIDTTQVQQAVTVPVTSSTALQQVAAQALLQSQQQQVLQAAQANAAATQAMVVTQAGGVATPQQTIQLSGGQVLQQPFQIVGQSAAATIPAASMAAVAGNQQVIQIPQPVQTAPAPQQAVQTPIVTPTQQATHVYQQVVTPTGEIQNVPIQITPAQFQAIQLQLQGKQAGQSIVIQTPGQQATAATDQAQFATSQPMYQIQQLTCGQPVFLPQTVQTTEAGVEAQVTEVHETAS